MLSPISFISFREISLPFPTHTSQFNAKANCARLSVLKTSSALISACSKVLAFLCTLDAIIVDGIGACLYMLSNKSVHNVIRRQNAPKHFHYLNLIRINARHCYIARLFSLCFYTNVFSHVPLRIVTPATTKTPNAMPFVASDMSYTLVWICPSHWGCIACTYI